MNDEAPGPALVAPMLNLDADCFEELFEWLSLADLRALRQTCKRLQKVVDYFIRTHYPRIVIGYGKVQIYQSELNTNPYTRSFDEFQQLTSDPIRVKMIKELNICVERLTNEKIDIFKPVLPQIEKLIIIVPKYFDGDFYESILKWCLSLKYLHILNIRSNKMIGNDGRWLNYQFPSLEHFWVTQYDQIYVDGQIDELKRFFESNPNIKTFTTDFGFFQMNQNCWLESNIKLDQLNLYGHSHSAEMDQVCSLVNTLYERGFCKHIRMDCIGIDSQIVLDQITSVRGMDLLKLSGLGIVPILSPKPNFRRLCLTYDLLHEDVAPFARNLVNLKQVYVPYVESIIIELFLLYTPKLKEIRVNDLVDRSHFKNYIIDLVRWNKIRGDLKGATKVTIYVQENLYLSTKFALKSIDLDFITLKRHQEVMWDWL